MSESISKPLTSEELELWQLYETLDGGNSLVDFVRLLSPTYTPPRHLLPLANLFSRAEREAVRACVSVPPRHGKTETILHGIAWFLLRHPDKTIVYVTYADDLAESKSRKARDLAKLAGVPIRKDATKVSEWRTIHGGGLIAAGRKGQITGKGADIFIFDDPIKDREEAESPTIRDSVWDMFTSTAMTRVEPGGSVIVNGTRWHPDDLIGRLMGRQEVRYEYINLPALDENGNALWPDRWPREAMEERRREVGEYDWASLFMGQPRPRGGRVFDEPARYVFPDVEGARILIGCDPAATSKNTSDYSVIAVLCAKGWGIEQVTDVIDVWRGQVEIPVLVDKLLEYQKHWQAPVAIEAVGGFKAVPQMLNRMNPAVRIIPVQTTVDKFTRALPVAAAWKDGRVRLPQRAPWLRDFLNEVLSFTGAGDKHDDQVDALAHGFNAISRMVAPDARHADAQRLIRLA